MGFSSFQVEAPKHLNNYKTVQYTLVDCPGHASLIKTIIGGKFTKCNFKINNCLFKLKGDRCLVNSLFSKKIKDEKVLYHKFMKETLTKLTTYQKLAGFFWSL